jgi:hypothetical protein
MLTVDLIVNENQRLISLLWNYLFCELQYIYFNQFPTHRSIPRHWLRIERMRDPLLSFSSQSSALPPLSWHLPFSLLYLASSVEILVNLPLFSFLLFSPNSFNLHVDSHSDNFNLKHLLESSLCFSSFLLTPSVHSNHPPHLNLTSMLLFKC